MITKDDPIYNDIVHSFNSCSYTIHAEKLKSGDSVQCPYDKDMQIQKNSDGTVMVKKKCFKKSPFKQI